MKKLLVATALAALFAALALAGCAPTPQKPAQPASSSDQSVEPTPDDETVVIEPISDGDPLSAFTAASSAVVLGSSSDAVGAAADNSCYSPLSLYMAMAMVGVGAEGEAQQQLLGMLNAASEEELARYCARTLDTVDEGFDPYELEIANSIWAQKGFKFSESYLRLADDVFDADAFNVDFGTQAANDQMARWVRDETEGLLNPQFETTDTQIASLINTLYFKDAWLDEFNASSTAPGTFHAHSGDHQADFMHLSKRDTSFADGDGYTAADLPFAGGGSMRFVLPDEGTTSASLVDSADKVAALLDREMGLEWVNWSLPKFTIDSSWPDLVSSMKALGVTDVFDAKTPGMFAGMIDAADGNATPGDFYVSSVVQETHLALDEKGVEAAAYTAVGIDAMSAGAQGEPVDFTLDRPFIYIITAPNNTPLFIGTVELPEQ